MFINSNSRGFKDFVENRERNSSKNFNACSQMMNLRETTSAGFNPRIQTQFNQNYGNNQREIIQQQNYSPAPLHQMNQSQLNNSFSNINPMNFSSQFMNGNYPTQNINKEQYSNDLNVPVKEPIIEVGNISRESNEKGIDINILKKGTEELESYLKKSSEDLSSKIDLLIENSLKESELFKLSAKAKLVSLENNISIYSAEFRTFKEKLNSKFPNFINQINNC